MISRAFDQLAPLSVEDNLLAILETLPLSRRQQRHTSLKRRNPMMLRRIVGADLGEELMPPPVRAVKLERRVHLHIADRAVV